MVLIHWLRFALPPAWLLAAAGMSPVRAAEAEIRFSREVLPILSDACFHCHGPAETGRKAGLRLDLPEGIRRVRDGRAVVVPGKPEASELVRRLYATDPDEVMPPPDSHRSLTAAQRDVLKRWVAAGAPWGKHWAFETLRETPVPAAGRGVPGRNEVDSFILARLGQEGLEPSAPADRATLLRRASLDLTGLPPTEHDLAEFAADADPLAYERRVERLLASPAYGERMANEWMDLARYADTYGYQADVDRDMSPWRDWVIRAFNGNLPFDQFVTWQVAGDLLPGATRDQVLATAFNRLHRQTNEGGSIEEEWRTEYVADRVHTLGTALLGLTLECSKCHDHKYDPISQRDYYSLFAFFNSIDESGLYSHFTQATPTPTLFLFGEGQEERHRALKRAVAEAEDRLARVRREAAAEAARAGGATAPELPAPVASFAFDVVEGGKSPDAASTNAATGAIELVPGRAGQALKFNGDDAVTCPTAGRFGRHDAFSFGLWLQPAERATRAVVLHCSQAWTDSGSRGYELVLDRGRPFFALIHFWPGNALAVRAKEPLPAGQWSQVTLTYDGSSRAGGVRLYLNGRPLETEIVRDNLYKDIQHRAEWGDSSPGGLSLTLGARFRDNGFRGGRVDDLRVFATELTPWEVGRLAGTAGEPTPDDRAAWWLARKDPQVAAAAATLRRARDEENTLITGVRELMVMRELARPRPTFILKRGAYDAPGEAVSAGTPERILPLPPGAPKNRLGLAQWLVSKENPLTARVAVNRAWKLHFGRGLVSTVEDFGMQGRTPTHPELLDWLAWRFMESGWDRKALHRLIMLSATYRQSSVGRPAVVARDPDNLLLARGPRHRLSAEQIRDRALAVSGLLVPKVGGPSVKPYQPAGVWEEAGTGKTYTQDHGEKLYRRSLYTFWRRTAPPPSMLTFDATSREVCTAKREVTGTPLQALVLLNDPQFLEAARVVAEQALRAEPQDASARAAAVFRRVTGRAATPRERELLQRMLDEQLAWFRRRPEAAEKYLSTGEKPRDPSLPVVELAATAVVASAAMNHDEFVMKR